MNFNKSTYIVPIVGAAILIGLGLWLSKSGEVKPPAVIAQNNSVNVGVILPLTGDAAVYGRAIKNGIELAKRQIDSSSAVQVNLTYEDDRGQTATAISAAQHLIAEKKIFAIIGGAMSSTAEAIIPLCNQSKVVLLSPTATKPSLTTEGGYFFRLWPSDEYDGKVMADVAFNKLGIKKIAVLFINTAYGAGITEVFERNFTKLGGVIVGKDGYAQGSTDFKTQLTKIKQTKPDAVYLPGYVAEVSKILKQARELNVTTRFLGVNSFYDPKIIELAGPAAEGAVFTNPTYDTASSDKSIAEFVAEYEKMYGEKPDAFAAQGYDSYMVLHRSLVMRPKNGEELRHALLNGKEYAGPGGISVFDAKGDVEKPLRIMTIRDGVFVTM